MAHKIDKQKSETQDIKKNIEESVPIIVKSMLDIIKNSNNDRAKIEAAKLLLDRCFGRPHQALNITQKGNAIDNKAIMAALADQARGVIIDTNEDGVQRLVITPSKQLPDFTVIDID